MPVRTDERQYRFMPLMAPYSDTDAKWEGRQKLIDSAYYVEGFATTYDQPYELWGGIYEQIARGALDGADLADVIMQYDHQGPVFARNHKSETLRLVPDHPEGFLVGADLSKREQARELYEAIANGLIQKMSWAFTIAADGDEWDEERKMFTVRKVKKVFDVSAVSRPANDATTISARARAEGALDLERRIALARKARIVALKSKL